MSITSQDLFARQLVDQPVGASAQRDTMWVGNADLSKTLNAHGVTEAVIAGLGSMFLPKGGDKVHEFFKKMHADIADAARSVTIGPSDHGLGGAIGSHGGGSYRPPEPTGIVIGPALNVDQPAHPGSHVASVLSSRAGLTGRSR